MSSKAAVKGKKGIAENAGPVPPQQPSKIFGCHIWAEMRMVCNLFDISNRHYRVEQIGDPFSEKGVKDEATFNTAHVMPLVIINDIKILADPATLAKHICRHYQMEQLYPLAPNMDSERQKIDTILDIVFLQFKRSADRIVKLVVQNRAIAASKITMSSAQIADKDKALAYEKNLFTEVIMRTVEQWLNETETSYLVSDKVSVADLAVFHEMMQAMVFGELSIDQNAYPRLTEWYSWIEQTWASGQLKGKHQFDELKERLNGA